MCAAELQGAKHTNECNAIEGWRVGPPPLRFQHTIPCRTCIRRITYHATAPCTSPFQHQGPFVRLIPFVPQTTLRNTPTIRTRAHTILTPIVSLGGGGEQFLLSPYFNSLRDRIPPHAPTLRKHIRTHEISALNYSLHSIILFVCPRV